MGRFSPSPSLRIDMGCFGAFHALFFFQFVDSSTQTDELLGFGKKVIGLHLSFFSQLVVGSDNGPLGRSVQNNKTGPRSP